MLCTVIQLKSTLRYVDFDSKELLKSYQKQIDAAHLSASEALSFLNDIETGLRGYTYFED